MNDLNNFEAYDPDINHYDNLIDSDVTIQSSYVPISQFQKPLNSISHVTFLAYNIRSFNANSHKFFPLFHNYEDLPDVLVLSETWFKDGNAENIAGFRASHIFRIGRASGGCSIYVKNCWSSETVTDLCISNDSIEICTVAVTFGKETIYVLGIYRPHSDSITGFASAINEILGSDIIRNKHCIVLGDINVNLLLNTAEVLNFVNLMQSYYFVSMINMPTVFHTNERLEPSLLDHIWTNKPFVLDSGIIATDFTDHCPVFLRIPINETSRQSDSDRVRITFRDKSESNKQIFKMKLTSMNWAAVQDEDVNFYMDKFLSALNKLYCDCFPLKSKLVGRKQFLNPWMTPYLRNLIKAKSTYFHLMKSNFVSRSENNQYRNRLNAILKKSKAAYFKNLFETNKQNMRKTWDIIKSLICGKSAESTKKIFFNNEVYTDSSAIANIFNTYFTSIGLTLSNELETTNLDPMQSVPHVTNTIYLTPVTDMECSKYIASLKVNTQGTDELPVKMLIEYRNHFAPILSDIINRSFTCGRLPNSLKRALVVPIHKTSDVTLVTNYRPISLLPPISKVFEKCIHVRLIKFLSKFSLLSINQFGFREGLSTQDAIIKLTEAIYSAINDRKFSCAIFVDFKKAFDTMNHDLLLRKLERYGIRGVVQDLIADYLRNRFQRVKFNNILSDPLPITIGVPQGSILGPLLFLIYVNDLSNILSSFLSIMYADDTTLVNSDASYENLINVGNAELKLFFDWSLSNRLSVNVEKTYYMIFGNRRVDDHSHNFLLGNAQLSMCDASKFLGINLDAKLTFNHHIELITNKVSKSIGIMFKLQNLLPFSCMKQLYYSLIYPYLNYCIISWGGTCPTYLNPLVVLQKRAIRVITKSHFLAHTTPLFFRCGVLKLVDLYKYSLAIYFYKNNLESNFARHHSYRTRGATSLCPIFQRLNVTQRSVNYAGPTIWNEIPVEIRTLRTLRKFKIALKKFYIGNYIIN